MGLMFYIGPTVGAKCSRRLTRVVFVRGLSSRARAPSFCSFCEYLKRSEQRGALAAVCTPTIKSASEKHKKGDTPVSNIVTRCSEGGREQLCNYYWVALIVLCTQCVRSETTRVFVTLCELGQNLDPLSNVPRPLFIHLLHLKRVKAH